MPGRTAGKATPEEKDWFKEALVTVWPKTRTAAHHQPGRPVWRLSEPRRDSRSGVRECLGGSLIFKTGWSNNAMPWPQYI